MHDLAELRFVQQWVSVAMEEGWKVVVVNVREGVKMCGVALLLSGGQRRQRMGCGIGVVHCAVPRVVDECWPKEGGG